jgi:hypothetical protein
MSWRRFACGANQPVRLFQNVVFSGCSLAKKLNTTNATQNSTPTSATFRYVRLSALWKELDINHRSRNADAAPALHGDRF